MLYIYYPSSDTVLNNLFTFWERICFKQIFFKKVWLCSKHLCTAIQHSKWNSRKYIHSPWVYWIYAWLSKRHCKWNKYMLMVHLYCQSKHWLPSVMSASCCKWKKLNMKKEMTTNVSHFCKKSWSFHFLFQRRVIQTTFL